MLEYVRSPSFRILTLSGAAFMGAIAATPFHRGASFVLILGCIVLAIVAVGLATESHPRHAVALIIGLPTLTFLLFPATQLAIEAFPGLFVPAALLCVVLALSGAFPRTKKVSPPATSAQRTGSGVAV